MALPIIESFSVKYAQICNGTDSFVQTIQNTAADNSDLRIYGAREASVEPSTSEWINEGDDRQLSIWSWIENAEVNVQSGYLSLPTYARITGNNLTESSVGGKQLFSSALWSMSSQNVAPFPMIIGMPAKDIDGKIGITVIGLYRVQPKPITLEGPAYKDGLTVSYGGTALISSKDEVGNTLEDPAVGRILGWF